MSSEALQVKLSQDNLFFPLPFTNATIDNVVQVKNPLPVVQGDPKANVIAFKILSEVQYRYSVRPPVGFIGAGEHVTIVFSFNPEHVKSGKNPAERELPTEATKDAIHVDFAVVDAPSVERALAHWAPGSKEAKTSREVVSDASQFWKQRGQVKKNSPTATRYKLRCVFAPRNNVPDSLVMCMKEEEDGKAKGPAAPVPTSRPPMTSSTQPRNTAPPEAPPHRHSESPRAGSAMSTPREGPGKAPPTAPAGPIAAAPVSRPAPPAAAAAAAVRKPPASGDSAAAGSLTAKGMLSQVMNYKLSYTVVGVLLLLTLLCGLLDQSNLLTWLLATH